MSLNLQYVDEMQKDRALHADMLECLRRGTVEVLHDSKTALLIQDQTWGLYTLSATVEAEGKGLLQELSKRNTDIVIRGRSLFEYARDHLGFTSSVECWQVLYEKDAPPQLQGILQIRRPDPEDFEKVAETYHIVDREQLFRNFNSPDFFGGYADGEFAGYVGLHPEGAMGMLHVFEKFRNRGFGRELTAFMIGHQLSQGRIPYCQVHTDNNASMTMLRGFGMTFSRETVYWMWNY